eukprot:2997019-Rhodomonas_salina.2
MRPKPEAACLEPLRTRPARLEVVLVEREGPALGLERALERAPQGVVVVEALGVLGPAQLHPAPTLLEDPQCLEV